MTDAHSHHEPVRGRCCDRRGGGGGRGALVEPAALAALLSSAGHGYDLRKAIVEITDGLMDVDAGGLYRILRRMEDEGLVASEWAEGDAGPQRREYHLTDAGIKFASHWLDHLRERQRLASMLADAIEASLPAGAVTDARDTGK